MNEPHAIQLRDGTLVLLCRADKDGYLWRTESGDGGSPGPRRGARRSPTRPPRSGWPASRTGASPSSGPSPTARDPLSLWLSEDEMRTWPVRVELDSWSANEAWFTRAGAGPSTALAYPTRCRRAGRCTSSTTSAGGTSCTWRSTWPGSEARSAPPASDPDHSPGGRDALSWHHAQQADAPHPAPGAGHRGRPRIQELLEEMLTMSGYRVQATDSALGRRLVRACVRMPCCSTWACPTAPGPPCCRRSSSIPRRETSRW